MAVVVVVWMGMQGRRGNGMQREEARKEGRKERSSESKRENDRLFVVVFQRWFLVLICETKLFLTTRWIGAKGVRLLGFEGEGGRCGDATDSKQSGDRVTG